MNGNTLQTQLLTAYGISTKYLGETLPHINNEVSCDRMQNISRRPDFMLSCQRLVTLCHGLSTTKGPHLCAGGVPWTGLQGGGRQRHNTLFHELLKTRFAWTSFWTGMLQIE